MPTSPDLLICDDVVAALNAAVAEETFSLPFTAERLYVADWDMKSELGELVCGVWPASAESGLLERKRQLKNWEIGVTFAKRVAKATLAQIDVLSDLVEAVRVFLALKGITTGGRRFQWIGDDYLLRASEARLERLKTPDGVQYTGVFASVFTLTYEEVT